MKKITITSQDFSLPVSNKLQINLAKMPPKAKIVDAILEIKLKSTSSKNFQLDYYNNLSSLPVWGNFDTVKSAGDTLKLNISEELQDCLSKGANTLILSASSNTVQFDTANSELNIDYISLAGYQDSGSSHSIDIGKSTSLTVDLTTRQTYLTSSLLASDNNVLPLSISANYNPLTKSQNLPMPNNWSLNVHQFLRKLSQSSSKSPIGSTNFEYIDGNGKVHIFEEKYTYKDINGKKQYLTDLSTLEINADGSLQAKPYSPLTRAINFDEIVKIEREYGSDSGLRLVSSIKDIKGAEKVDYEPEELSNLREQIKQLKENEKLYEDNQESLKKQIFMTCLTKYISGNSILKYYVKTSQSTKDAYSEKYTELIYKTLLDKKSEYFDDYFGENKLFSKNELETMLSNLETAAKYKMELSKKYSADNNITIEFPEKENQPSAQADYASPDDEENASPDDEEKYLSTPGDTELLNYQLTLDSYEKQYKNNQDKLGEIATMLEKCNAKLEALELQSPVHYIYDENNIIYGFGKTNQADLFRLILIGDYYENFIYIGYDDLKTNKIVSITDSSEKEISFEYDKNGLLSSITDARGRRTKLRCTGSNLTQITRTDDSATNFYYDADNQMHTILDQSGKGVNITNATDQIILEGISLLDKVENGKIYYKDTEANDDNFEYYSNLPFSAFSADKYKEGIEEKVTICSNTRKSTTVTDFKGKSLTYIFDKYGKTRTIYENKFPDTDTDEFSVKTTNFDYQKDKIGEKISVLPYADNYLSDTCFDMSTIRETPALYLGNAYCSDTTIPYNTQTCSKIHRMEENQIQTNTTEPTESVKPVVKPGTPSEETPLTPVPRTDTLSMSAEKLALLNGDTSSCSHKAYVLSGWAKAPNAAFTLSDEQDSSTFPEYIKIRKFELNATLTYSDNSQVHYCRHFDWQCTDWQYLAIPIALKKDLAVQSLTCTIDFSNNTGSLEYTDLEFKEADWEKATYDDSDRLIKKETAHSQYVTDYFYDDDTNKLIREETYKDASQKLITRYEYNSQGNLTRTIDSDDMVKENVYNDKGIALKTMTYHKDEPTSKYYEEEKLDDKGKTTAQINDLGDETTQIEYLNETGIISAQIDENGTKTALGYDKSDRLIEKSITIDGIENTNTFGYTLDYLTSLKHNGFKVEYDYDSLGRTKTVKIAGKTYLTKSYSDDQTITTLENGEIFRQTFNDDGKVLDTFYKKNQETAEQPLSQNFYDVYGNLIFSKDLTDGENLHKIYIDKFGQTYLEQTSQHTTAQTTVDVEVKNNYDTQIHNRINSTDISIGANKQTYSYSYADDLSSTLTQISTPIGTQTLNYDNLGRLSSLSLGNFSKDFSYLKNGDHASNLVSKLEFSIKGTKQDNLRYLYDKKGNISEIRQNNTLLARYSYDALSRIIREDNKVLEKTVTFTYDEGGNITKRIEYPFTLTDNLDYLESSQIFDYRYSSTGWKDQLLEYNGEKFEYDELGNPTTYRNKALTWSHGRQLDKFGDIAQYSYNASGIRTRKQIPAGENEKNFNTHFILNGNKILQQIDAGNTLTFYYGADGVTGFHIKSTNAIYKGQPLDHDFYYKKNAQNDIIGIVSTENDIVAEYAYDAFGNIFVKNFTKSSDFFTKIVDFNFKGNYTSDISTELFIALKNPFLYRGYYYDFESNLYYLNSRYYDPETGRFVNIDDVDILDKTEDLINGLNLYTYCLNNPVNCHDPVGYFALTSLIVGLIIGAIIGATVGGAFAYKTAKSSGATGWELAGWTLLGVFGGAVIGGAIGAGLGYLAGVAFPAINAFLSSTFTIGFGGGLSLATGGTIGGGITISVGSAVTVGGSIAGSLGSLILFAKGTGPRMGHNQHENQMWKEAMRQLGIDDKDLMRRLHNEIHKGKYNETLKELIKALRDILTKWGK